MSWIWEKSATWRWLVAVTKRSPAAMAAFTIGMCVVPYYAGKAVMSGTSMVTEQGTSLEQQLRARQTLEHKVRCTSALCVSPDEQCAEIVTQGLKPGTRTPSADSSYTPSCSRCGACFAGSGKSKQGKTAGPPQRGGKGRPE